MRRILAASALLAVVASACSVQLGDPQEAAPLGDLPSQDQPVTAVVRRVLPAVVNVTTDVFQTDPFGNAEQGQGVGTGFIVRQDGIVVTNCHVIEGASRITVSTSDEEPKRYDARVIGGDCENDLAVLKADATGLPTVPLGDSSSLKLGQTVVALGYALALEGGPSVTTGIVSSLSRTIEARDPNCTVCPDGVRTYPSVIQTDAAINRGNSGGPLVDLRGRVVGINTAGNDAAENVGFAIPIDAAKDVIQQSISEPLAAVAYLGVSTQTVTADVAFQLGLSAEEGAYVLATTADGPARLAGIEEGDVIVSIGGNAIATAEDLGTALAGFRPGDEVAVVVENADGQRRTVDVTLGTRPLPVGDIP